MVEMTSYICLREVSHDIRHVPSTTHLGDLGICNHLATFLTDMERGGGS